MTPEAIAARLLALREAGLALRRRPARERIAALARVLDGWSDPGSTWRKELAERLPAATGFSAENVREGLAWGLDDWGGASLDALVRAELGDVRALEGRAPVSASGFDVTSVVLAGQIPMPTLVSLLAPLVLGSPVLAKCAARDPVTAPLVARSVAEVDAELGACVDVVAFPGSDTACSDALLRADCVVATGSDETVAEIAARVTPPRRLVTAGHRLSLAVLGDAATRGEALLRACAGLALDVSLWDQLGCLSPIAVFVVSEDPEARRRVGEALATQLETAERRRPRGRVETDAAIRFAHERDAAELRAAAGDVALHAGEAFAVVCENDATPRAAPLHRFVRVHPVADRDALLRAVRPMGSHLAGVALAGFAGDTAAVARALARCGASRLCEPGRLQAPPLSWRHEGRGVLLPLARFTDFDFGSERSD